MTETTNNVLFLKLGGSLITDKTRRETPRFDVIKWLAAEVREALDRRPDLKLVIGHGSGSFGHFAAKPYGTREGVHTPEQWAGYCQVGAAAARLNRLVTGAFLQAGVPVLSLQPGASALCRDGKLQAMTIKPIVDALDHNLLPMVYGDVAFDEVRGGTIISTEEIFAILADKLRPARILLAGEAPGVIGPDNQVIALLRPGSPEELALSVGASHGVDVTGGMLSKVTTMLDLVERFPSLQVRIFSGLSCGGLLNTLIYPDYQTGTLLSN